MSNIHISNGIVFDYVSGHLIIQSVEKEELLW